MAQPVERPVGRELHQRPQLRGDIEFRNVKFSYPNRQTPRSTGQLQITAASVWP